MSGAHRLAALACTSAALLAACGAGATPPGPGAGAGAGQPGPVPHSAAPVALGTEQDVLVASSFGPGAAEVPVRMGVLAFRDRVVASDGAVPAAPGSHWASAEVSACRPSPVLFGYPAWVLGDDDGRTAQVTKVLHPGFPGPAFPDDSTATGCARGWVTWVTPDALHATRVSFEQARSVPGPWRLR